MSDVEQTALWALANREKALAQLDKLDAEDKLINFIKLMWPILEPGTQFIDGWAVNAICEHLEAVSRGEINRLLINVPPGPGWVENTVLTAKGPKRLGDVQVGDQVLTDKSRFRTVIQTHGTKPWETIQITTHAGRVTYATPEHKIITSRGWIPASELRVGDVLRVPVSPDIEQQLVSNDTARLLGYLVGDGSLASGTPNLTSGDEEVIQDAVSIAAELGFKTSVQRYGGKAPRVSFLGGRVFRQWLAQFGLEGKTSYTKTIPPQILASSNETIRHFLGGYWTADGNVNVRETRSRGSVYRTSCTTVSRQLVVDLQQALTRLGVRSHLRTRTRKARTKAQPGGIYTYFTLEVHSERDSAVLSDCPIIERKRSQLRKCRRGFPRTFIEDEVQAVTPSGERDVTCITVAEDHSMTWDGLATSNCMKSLTTNVFWPAWEWGPRNMPHLRYVAAAYAEQLTLRDNRKALTLLKSPEYQERWGDRLILDKDEQSKGKFANTKMGFKLATAVGGSATGERGDRVIIDDPHSVAGAESDAKRKEALYWFTETMPSRVNSEDSAIVIIMQRIHEDDISGLILAEELGYDHLCLPMWYEKDHPHKSQTALDFKDPRTEDGELLWPELFPESRVTRDEKVMRSVGGEYAVSGQHQQRPAPRGGGMFQEDDFTVVTPQEVPNTGQVVRGWDIAASKDDRAAFSAGVRVRRTNDGSLYIEDVRRGRWKPSELDEQLIQAARDDGLNTIQDLPQDPGAAGKIVKSHFAKLLEGYTFHITPESGSKEDRARPLASQAEAGKIHLVQGPWNRAFLNEITTFPAGKYKDQVDAATRAYGRLLKKKKRKVGAGPTVIGG